MKSLEHIESIVKEHSDCEKIERQLLLMIYEKLEQIRRCIIDVETALLRED